MTPLKTILPSGRSSASAAARCIDACTHGAREGIDDFDAFMAAVSAREQIIAIVAPAVASNFPGEYLHLNGWLKSLGVKAIFDVSFGAELTVKSYLEAIKTKAPKCVIAQPCAALVSYIEIYQPDLLQHLAPADSPMVHTMKMVRKFYPRHGSGKFVVLSPCFAKKREFDEVGIGDFNVAYTSIDAYLTSRAIKLSNYPKVDYDNPPAERAVLFSTPGGLLRTAVREAPGLDKSARKIEGVPFVYHYLSHLRMSVAKHQSPLLVDCLSCEMGWQRWAGDHEPQERSRRDRIPHRIEEPKGPGDLCKKGSSENRETGPRPPPQARKKVLGTGSLRPEICEPFGRLSRRQDTLRLQS